MKFSVTKIQEINEDVKQREFFLSYNAFIRMENAAIQEKNIQTQQIGEKELLQKENPYKNSVAFKKLSRRNQQGLPPRIAFLDIDATLSGNPEAAQKVRGYLDKLGFVTVFVTSRTEEMTMSRKAHELSARQYNFERPGPKLKKDPKTGKQLTAFPDELGENAGLYDPDIIAGTTGSCILLRQQDGGYISDSSFEKRIQRESQSWREEVNPIVQQILKEIDPEGKIAKSHRLDEPENYHSGACDVMSPTFRVHADFIAPGTDKPLQNTGATHGGVTVPQEALEQARQVQQEFITRFQEFKSSMRKKNSTLGNIRVTSHSNPEKGRLSLYFTPLQGTKARATETVVNELCGQLGIKRSNLETLMVGDSYPDLSMGLQGALGTNASFLLVGGSRLTSVTHEYDTEKQTEFGGVGVTAIQRRLQKIADGIFSFRTPLFGPRNVIVGNTAYLGTAGPETIVEYLEDKYSSELAI